jgi:hypothetical protein
MDTKQETQLPLSRGYSCYPEIPTRYNIYKYDKDRRQKQDKDSHI